MKGRIFMYLFVFAMLLVVFQYANSKNIFDTYQEKMTKLIEREQILKDSIINLNKELMKYKKEL
ncbi:hypothetical protein LX77_00063 [Gelidibacter algens]|jgi:hypothetical protein|uniref:Uncharacterized protein n=1 Tax=Gelidibacter algens TaxID=49280 RepID=A0A1A7QP40_9FLAO|nr:hypothetical protein [Gelidibacter algens]OBX21830.1 hypothetical protein A9996_17650 [Gelidibacter algens]RAJ27491.1 hypothetical protein LX77_00063 [Gelidibacter algens]